MTLTTPAHRARSMATLLLAGAAMLVATGCSDADTPAKDDATAPATPPTSSSQAPQDPPIVGLWRQTHSCRQLGAAFDDAGMSAAAPVAMGDYFPDMSGKQIQAKPDPCSGSAPQRHAHFFTASGEFGSVDAEGNQVDGGKWRLVDDDTLRIGQGTFDFKISNDTLVLQPVIKDADREAALRSPLDFSVPVWQVAVAYGGRPWRAAPCEQWC